MGCGASVPEVDLATVDGGMTTSVPDLMAGVTTGRTGYFMKEKFFSWSGDDYDIKDSAGNVAIKVAGKALSMRDRMVLKDANGNKVAMLQKKILAVRKTFQLYTYKPNFEGQESTETEGGTPVYRYAHIEDVILSALGEAHLKKYETSNDEAALVPYLTGKVQLSFKFKVRVHKYGDPLATVANIGQSSFFQWEGANSYVIDCCAGIDSIALIAFAIALEKIKEEKKQ